MRAARDRRHFRRYDVEDVHGRLSVRTELEILNMSLTGIAVSSPVPVAPGSERTIALTDRDGRQVEINGRSQRCQMSGSNPPRFEIGFDFTSDLGGKAPSILGFLEAHIVVDLDRRLCGRFALDHPDLAEMRSDVEFEVQRISRSGMLVETDLLVFDGEENLYDLIIDSGGLRLRTRGRVAMVQQQEDEPTRLGVEFVGLDEEQTRSLHAFIRGLIG